MTKPIATFYEKFPTDISCINYLETVIWSGVPACPYCKSLKQTPIKNNRYHCNTCNTSYSVTVSTPFHKTKVDFQKWFFTISLLVNEKDITARQLASDIGVTKDTAWYMITRIRKELSEYGSLLEKLSDNFFDK